MRGLNALYPACRRSFHSNPALFCPNFTPSSICIFSRATTITTTITMARKNICEGNRRFSSSLSQSTSSTTTKHQPDELQQLSFHKRVLPSSLISLSSPKGKVLFKEALSFGGMESFFALSEQFVTQSEPSFCALSSLAMVLNALSYDPKRNWKGSWRWVSEEMLQCETMQVCGHSLDKIRVDGMSFGEFESLAQCHDVPIKSYRVLSPIRDTATTTAIEEVVTTVEHFREHVIATSTSDRADSFIVVNFSRKVLGQTGDGHFSPIGGYHAEKDLVLVMDVARFKYPPFWVPLTELWNAMTIHDAKSNQTRGFFILSTTTTNGNGNGNGNNSNKRNDNSHNSMNHSNEQHQHSHHGHKCNHENHHHNSK